MRTSRIITVFAVALTFVMGSCCRKVLNFSNEPDFQSAETIPLKDIIIRYHPDSVTTDFQLELNQILGQKEAKKCPCSDAEGYELLYFDFDELNDLEIEQKVGIIKSKGGGGAEGGKGDANRGFEFNIGDLFSDSQNANRQYVTPVSSKMLAVDPNGFFFNLPLDSIPFLNTVLQQVLGQKNLGDLVKSPNSTTPIIAILDTGLDPGLFQESNPFLFNTETVNGQCNLPNASPYGMNFINPAANVFDGHGHGSLVTKLITEKLESHQLDFSILPLKILDESGRGSYWNMLCALSYLSKINNHSNGRLAIANMSFGGVIQSPPIGTGNDIVTDENNRLSLFKDMLNQFENAAMIASAGNKGEDNDIKYHFPSNLDQVKKMAVGGYELVSNGTIEAHPDANHGDPSVEVATLFSGYDFSYNNRFRNVRIKNLTGTSYGAAYISSEFYKFLAEGEANCRNTNHIGCFLQTKTNTSSLLNDRIKDNKYVKY